MPISEATMNTATPEPFVPPPMISQHTVLVAGFAVILQLTSLWTTILLATVVGISKFIPYCFRTTDRADERRRLYDEFIRRPDPLIQKVVTVPDYVHLEERYWINSR
jgi:hypothetical protein